MVACFEAAATVTGCTVEVKDDSLTFYDLRSNPILAKLYAVNLKKLGINNYKYEKEIYSSTDMGNVSYVVPSLHSFYAIGSKEVNHT